MTDHTGLSSWGSVSLWLYPLEVKIFSRDSLGKSYYGSRTWNCRLGKLDWTFPVPSLWLVFGKNQAVGSCLWTSTLKFRWWVGSLSVVAWKRHFAWIRFQIVLQHLIEETSTEESPGSLKNGAGFGRPLIETKLTSSFWLLFVQVFSPGH